MVVLRRSVFIRSASSEKFDDPWTPTPCRRSSMPSSCRVWTLRLYEEAYVHEANMKQTYTKYTCMTCALKFASCLLHRVNGVLLERRACRITSVHNRHALTCAECCSSSCLWHTQVRSRPISSTA